MRSLSLLVAMGLLGCGGGFPPPHDQMAAAQKTLGRAQEGGASAVPDAKLHLQLAQEDLARAKELMERDNERASSLISRANAEAELALSLARENAIKAEAQQVEAQLAKLKGKSP